MADKQACGNNCKRATDMQALGHGICRSHQ